MKFSFNIGKHSRGLSDQQKHVLERLQKHEITLEQAERELVGHVEVHEQHVTLDGRFPATVEEDGSTEPMDETPEERTARELVERIAREVDAESAR